MPHQEAVASLGDDLAGAAHAPNVLVRELLDAMMSRGRSGGTRPAANPLTRDGAFCDAHPHRRPSIFRIERSAIRSRDYLTEMLYVTAGGFSCGNYSLNVSVSQPEYSWI